MVTAYKGCGFRIVIFLNDHLPAHVHVFAGRGESKINLLGPDGDPELVYSYRATKAEVRRAMELVVSQRDALLQRWENIHGRIDQFAA